MDRHRYSPAALFCVPDFTGEDSDAFRGRGLVYQALGRLAEARADFRRAIELDPGLATELGDYLEDQAE
ncbi:MAG TPA: tetratricopeptide repeat protein [Streptosporangiaceae bacterium]|nr:tetratricopeptide repeat protein [Streptosporangiaceae bacterium]